MIKLTQAELTCFNIINAHLQSSQAEVQRTLLAQSSYIQLLEIKYKATFNPETGEFVPITKRKPKANGE